jgi:TonB-linked SusC/RagA family outer membrane protein
MHFPKCKWLAMKLTLLFVAAAFLHAQANISAQTVSLHFEKEKIEKVFKEIQKQTGYTIVYNSKFAEQARPVTVNSTKSDLQEALKQIFENQPFTYEIQEKIIVLKEKPSKQLAVDLQSTDPLPPPTVHGRITNEKGEPVAGVNISIKGGKVIGVTGDNGEFTLTNVVDNITLVFSAVTIETFEIKLNGRTELALNLKTKTSVLDEVQIIAYGQTSKRLQTGNVTTVKGEDIAKQPVSNPLLALEGRVPGLFITQSTGLPGSGVSVRIQGQNSINKGNDPLYIIDGVPFSSQLLPSLNSPLGSSNNGGSGNGQGYASGNGNPLSFINPSDIESIEVLKDADATAIYGSRASNGAILITTKKGRSGKSKVSVNLQNGWGKVTRRLEVMNTQQYLKMIRDGKQVDNAPTTATEYPVNGVWDTTRNIDWQKELIGGTAKYQDAQFSIAGGSDAVQFSVGGGFHRETTVFPGNLSDSKGSVHINLNNLQARQRFHFQLSANYLADDNQLQVQDLTNTAITLPPDAPSLYNADGSLNWAPNASGVSTWINPLSFQFASYRNRTSSLVGNSLLSYAILPGLEIRANLGYTRLAQDEVALYNPFNTVIPEERTPSITIRNFGFGNNSISTWIAEPQLNYKRRLWRGNIDFLLGATFTQTDSKVVQLAASGFSSDAVMEDIKSASSITANTSVNSTYKYSALFGRINYSLSDKYIVNLTARRDGSSRFGINNQFHNFGAAGAAWIFSKEDFLKSALPFISFGKLRGSYGTTGNDLIGDYAFLSRYSTFTVANPYRGVVGLLPAGLSNADLQWEETKKMQFGIDLGFMNDRILIGVNYFNNTSSNQLLAYTLPYTSGFANIPAVNFPATIQNSGWGSKCKFD